jgi:hypothetical protein
LETAGGHVIEAAERGRVALHDRFPGCLVHAHRPVDAGNDVMIGCWAITSDGSVWKGESPLRPIREVDVPMFLEQDAGRIVRRVECAFLTPKGRRLQAPIQLLHDELRFLVDADPEGRYVLPAGTYRVGLLRSIRALHRELREKRVVVSEASPPGDELLIPIQQELISVRFRGRSEGRPDLAVVHVDVNTSDNDGFVIANWDPTAHDINMFVPPGEIILHVRSVGYRDATIKRRVEESTVVEIPLIQR